MTYRTPNGPVPIDYNQIRKTLCNQVTASTGLLCVLYEPEQVKDSRPKLPYFTMKIMGVAGKVGDDSYSQAGTEESPSTQWNFGGTRRLTVSFECYGNTHEEAYSYMQAWMAALDTIPVQQNLQGAGVPFWQCLDITDASELLNTGWEGRAIMDAYFGVVSNVTVDLGAIEAVPIEGEIISDSGTFDVEYTIQEE